MTQLEEELDAISELISENPREASKALEKFRVKYEPFKLKGISAKVDLLTLIIASVFNNYDKQKIDDKKLLAWFEKEEKFDEAAQVLLTKARHFFTHSNVAEGEKQLAYLREHFLDKISLRVELVYLTRVAFVHGRKHEYDERMKVSLLALDKMKSMHESSAWYYNLYTIFCINIADDYFNNSDYEKALPYLKESLEIAEKQNISSYNKYNVYSTMAYYYSQKHEGKMAAGWFDRIIKMLGGVKGYEHYVYQACLGAAAEYMQLFDETPQQKIELQQAYLNKESEYLKQVQQSIKADLTNGNYLLLLKCLATLEKQKGNYEKALQYLNKCFPVYIKQKHHPGIIGSHQLFHEIYYGWGNQTNDVKKLLKAYDHQKLHGEMVMAEGKQTNRQKLEAIQAKHELQQKQLSEKLLQQQIEAMNKEMQLTALNLHEKILLLDELKVYVHSLRKKEFEMKQFINAISQKIGAIKITEQDKAVLQQKIDEGNNGLFKVLAAMYPTLTTHEVKTCGLLKTGMTNKELSKLYGLSEKGYEQLRYRIKKKMKLRRDDNLIKHLMDLSAKQPLQ